MSWGVEGARVMRVTRRVCCERIRAAGGVTMKSEG